MVLIFVLSSEHRFPQPSAFWDDALAVAAHLFLFGMLTLLMIYALPQPQLLTGRQVVTIVVGTVAYGVSDEVHQSFVPGRDASLFDVAIDGVGAVVTVALWCALMRFKRS